MQNERCHVLLRERSHFSCPLALLCFRHKMHMGEACISSSSTSSLQRIESMTSVTQEARCNYLQFKGILTFSMVVTLMMLLMMMAVKNTKNDNDDNEMITKMAMVMTRMMMPMMMQLRGEARCACVPVWCCALCALCGGLPPSPFPTFLSRLFSSNAIQVGKQKYALHLGWENG